jgi:biopolymer transport protein ExbB/TolQ
MNRSKLNATSLVAQFGRLSILEATMSFVIIATGSYVVTAAFYFLLLQWPVPLSKLAEIRVDRLDSIVDSSEVAAWSAPSNHEAVFSLKASADDKKPVLNLHFTSNPVEGGGIALQSSARPKDEKFDLLKISDASWSRPFSPAVTAPVSVEFVDALLDEDLKKGGANAIPAEFLTKAKEELKAGLVALELSDMTTGFNDYYWRRVNSGSIQMLTFVAFWAAFLIMSARYWLFVYRERKAHEEVLEKWTKEFKSRDWQDPEAQIDAMINALQGAIPSDKNDLTITHKLLQRTSNWLHNGADRLAIAPLIEEERKAFERYSDAEYQPIRYLIWAIPTIGFVGTIVGVGQAMLATSRLASPEEIVRVLARADVSANIGVAFDTTLVALILSLIANLIFYFLQSREASILNESRDEILGFLVKLGSAVTAEEMTQRRMESSKRAIANLDEQMLKKRTSLDGLGSEKHRVANRLSKLQARILQLKTRSELGKKMIESWTLEIADIESQRVKGLETRIVILDAAVKAGEEEISKLDERKNQIQKGASINGQLTGPDTIAS